MLKQRNGYDRYLDYQYGNLGSFFTSLFQAITKADEINIQKLQRGFPEEVDAYELWSRVSWRAVLEKCTPGNPQIERTRKEYG